MCLDVNTPINVFGATEAKGWTDVLNDWHLNDRKARSTQRALAERLAHAARVFAGDEKGCAEQLRGEKNQELSDSSIRWAEANQHTNVQQTAASSGEVAPKPLEYA